MTSRPGIPPTEFVPVPPHPREPGGRSLWGITLKAYTGDVVNVELLDPDDVTVDGRDVDWYPADDGSGVLYGRARNAWGYPVAVARAVPLS